MSAQGEASTPPITTINLMAKFRCFSDLGSPKIIADLNSSHVKLAKVHGEFVWHHHAAEDELFLVVPELVEPLLIEPRQTLHTGKFACDRTARVLNRI